MIAAQQQQQPAQKYLVPGRSNSGGSYDSEYSAVNSVENNDSGGRLLTRTQRDVARRDSNNDSIDEIVGSGATTAKVPPAENFSGKVPPALPARYGNSEALDELFIVKTPSQKLASLPAKYGNSDALDDLFQPGFCSPNIVVSKKSAPRSILKGPPTTTSKGEVLPPPPSYDEVVSGKPGIVNPRIHNGSVSSGGSASGSVRSIIARQQSPHRTTLPSYFHTATSDRTQFLSSIKEAADSFSSRASSFMTTATDQAVAMSEVGGHSAASIAVPPAVSRAPFT